MITKTHFISCTIAFFAISIYFPFFFKLYIYLIILFILPILFGIILALWINIMLSSPHKTIIGAENVLKQSELFRNKLLKDYDPQQSIKQIQNNVPQIFGRTVDSLLQQLLDFIIRDHIIVYLKDYAYDLDYLSSNIKDDWWGAIKTLHEKFLRIDHAKLIACDIVNVVTIHLEKIREAKMRIIETDMPPEFQLSPHVISSEKELDYLRNVGEFLMMFLLPRTYSLSPTKYFLREVLCCKVFKPLVDLITDPDFFNRNLINYIEKNNQQKIVLPHKSLENLELIEKIDDIQLLNQIRYNIVTKLMQATTLQNLNRAKGVDLDTDKVNLQLSGIQKSEINAAKKLRKTINHLTAAKNVCEKRLIRLNRDQGFQAGDDFSKVLSLQTIIDHLIGRKFLSQFLQTLASHDLIRFWIAVEELRTAQRNQWHQLGAEIFYTFIRNPISEIKVDKITRRRMEAFLLGDKGPEVFYEVQQQVIQTIEDKYYQPFLISDYYKQMLIAIENENDLTENDSLESGDDKQCVVDSSMTDVENALNVGDHSNYARRKLEQLEEKLSNKMQALAALSTSMKPESKVLCKLEKEVQWLEGEKRQLEAHLTRTEIWAENLGRWTAIVQSAEIPEEKEPIQFVLVVQMSEDNIPGEEPGICSGWVVCRSLTQFQDLNKKLRPLCTEIRSLELPSSSYKFLFGKNDKSSLDRAKMQIQKYLDFVLKNDRLNQSEAVYSFLSPSSEHLKHSTPSPTKKSRFSLSTIFKSASEQSAFSILKDNSEEEICLDRMAVDGTDFSKPNGHSTIKTGEDGKDSIAEPLYGLLGELFDMRGVFKYLRKSLIAFVQVTYGRNINRQIYETVSWWFSEEMLHYYVAQILKNFWPGGAPAPNDPKRTNDIRLETAQKAQEMIINNVPEILTTLVGGNAARNGAKKLFDALQEKNMNKQLFYNIFETVLDAAFPELS